ncbi:MAG: flagellar basal body-associated FliL family protein [Acidobacteriia bacterium]|nr:flagellar basal body-associated FliL family protein [Terriglobia bacterium]
MSLLEAAKTSVSAARPCGLNKIFFGTPLAPVFSVTEPETQAAPPERPASKTKWIVLAGIVVALAVLGVTLLLRASPDNPKAPAPEGTKVKSVLHLDTFVMNLADPEEKAYLRVGIDLGLQDEVKARDGEGAPPVALVRDTILGVLAQCKPDELLTPEGKTKLKTDLVHALRQRAPELGVEEVYFTEFLIQR